MSQLAQTIVVATDFSDASHLALRAAAELAKQNEATLYVMHVYVPPDTKALVLDPSTGFMMADDDTRSKLHDELNELIATVIPEAKAKAKTAITTSRRPADGICHYAEHVDADMIVVATHGRTGLGRFFIGSVAEEVVRRASCPVLTLRSKSKK